MKLPLTSFLPSFSLAVCAACLNVAPALSIESPEAVIAKDVGVFTKLGTTVDLNLRFTDSQGKGVSLRELNTQGRPLLVVPVYYRCPRLCGLVMDGLTTALNALPIKVGKDFAVVAVSINPEETPKEAQESADKFFARLSGVDPQVRSGWHFLTGAETSIQPLMSALGFGYLKDGVDYAHSAAFMILTPEGKISQYFTGIEYSPFDLRLALIEASTGAVGSALDHFLLYCFRFDPLQGKYTWAVVKVLRIGGLLTLLALGVMYYLMYSRRSRRKGAAAA